MKNSRLFIFLTIVLLSSFLLPGLSCKKAESPESSKAPADIDGVKKDAAQMPAEETAMEKKQELKDEDGDKRDLKTPFLAPMEAAKDRLLEYKVSLTYESEKFFASRQVLLDITGKYGFIKSSNSSTEDEIPRLNAEVHVRSGSLYDALKEMDKLGILLSEDIAAVDHTEEMELARSKIKRENLRIARKGSAIGRISAGNKQWQEREDALENSENELDKSEHDKWRINDLVSWSKIYIQLRGPEVPGRIKVPVYTNALIGLVNFLLNLLYVLIYLIPIAAVFILIWRQREVVKVIFKKKSKE